MIKFIFFKCTLKLPCENQSKYQLKLLYINCFMSILIISLNVFLIEPLSSCRVKLSRAAKKAPRGGRTSRKPSTVLTITTPAQRSVGVEARLAAVLGADAQRPQQWEVVTRATSRRCPGLLRDAAEVSVRNTIYRINIYLTGIF